MWRRHPAGGSSAALERLGIAAAELGGREIRGIRYLDVASGRTAEGRFSGRPGLGVRRTALHGVLARRAEDAGARLSWGLFAESLSSTDEGAWVVDTPEGPIEARWVVGADGLASHTRRWAGLDQSPSRRRRYGVRRHYRIAPWTDQVEVYWTDGCEAYVTPVADDLVGVAMLWGGSREGFDRHLAKFPALAERLRGAATASRDRGCGPFLQRATSVVRGTLALVGDAAGYVDALTGEGLGIAFAQAMRWRPRSPPATSRAMPPPIDASWRRPSGSPTPPCCSRVIASCAVVSSACSVATRGCSRDCSRRRTARLFVAGAAPALAKLATRAVLGAKGMRA